MADNAPKKPVNKLIIAIISAVVVVAIVVVVFIMINGKEDDKKEEETSKKVIGYEANVVANEDDDLQSLVDDMIQKAQEGSISLEFKNTAYSSDGEKFSCYIANSIKNNYDMFLTLYKDVTYENEMYLSGLIPVGSAIEGFTVDEKLEKGEYDMVLVVTQVKDDHETLHNQVSVALKLIVR